MDMTKDRPTIEMPPAEKKRLSYKKDCRPSYGNNDKAARKAVPRRKAIENRTDRHAARNAIAVLSDRSEADADLIESSLLHDVYRVGGWRKGSDTPLGEVVKSQKEARISRVDGKARRRVKQAEFCALLDVKTKN
ncbi:hypothetical protein [Asticcacaulis taihuensis]|uniref:hypothetical protein n=1 Tax=Asticcacaulis taihuensis TaxID=260084 RepID=UPI0026EDDE6F|nr:hypothetical protein [Asticcacaulis taihuensis]